MRYSIWTKILQKYIKTYSIDKDNILDIGCASGKFKDFMGNKLNQAILGVDPNPSVIDKEKLIFFGYCHKTPFKECEFDLITLISVFEHVHPKLRFKSIKEIKRILKPNGYLFVQMPNPKFPLEFHTRLPFVGYLPRNVQLKYVKLLRNRKLGFWQIATKDFLYSAQNAGFEILDYQQYRYPKDIFPNMVKKFYFLTRIYHMGAYAILRKKS